MMRRWITMTCLLAALAAMASAQSSPTTQPGGRGLSNNEGFWRMPPEQFAIIHDFTQEHMPNLFKLATKSPPWRRVRLMRYAFTRMMTFNQARNDDQLRDKVATDIESEDEMFSILDQWEDASPSEQPALHEKLHDQMQQVVDNLLTERMERLDRLKSRLDEEEKKLADDRAHRDEIVDDRVERWTTEGPLRPPTTAPTTMPAK